MSIPVTMRALYWRLTATLTVETSPEAASLIITENETLAASCPVAETNVSLPVEEPAEIPMETSVDVSGNETNAVFAASVGSYVISAASPQSVDTVNTETPVKPYLAHRDVFPRPHWSTNEPMTI